MLKGGFFYCVKTLKSGYFFCVNFLKILQPPCQIMATPLNFAEFGAPVSWHSRIVDITLSQ